MGEQKYLKFLQENPGKIWGGFLGLLVAIIFVFFGFWRGLFILLFVSAGIYLGALVEKSGGLSNFLDRFRCGRGRY